MHIAVDVDGVLGEQIPALLEVVRPRYGVRMEKEDVQSWAEPIPGTDTDVEREIERELRNEAFVLSMGLVEGAREAMRELDAAGHRLTITTGRRESIREATEEWLDRKAIPYHEIRVTRDRSKATVAADLLIDDYHHNAREFADDGRNVVLFRQPWNRHFVERHADDYGSIHPADGWDEVLETLDRLEPRLTVE